VRTPRKRKKPLTSYTKGLVSQKGKTKQGWTMGDKTERRVRGTCVSFKKKIHDARKKDSSQGSRNPTTKGGKEEKK